MEVTSSSNQGPVQPRRNAGDDRIDITRINREGIQDATEDISEIRAPLEPYALRAKRQSAETQRGPGDRIELSEESKQLLARETDSTTSARDARERHVRDLRQQYLEGRLNSAERVDRAASEMLSPS